MQTYRVRDLLEKLSLDQKRLPTPGSTAAPVLPFSQDVQDANDVLFHPFAADIQKQSAINLWAQKNQPCVFGQIAAAKNMMHYCILSDADLQRPDEQIAEKIRVSRIKWKQRSLRPTPNFSTPAHGFVLLVASQKVANARADDSLKEFSSQVLSLWKLASTETAVGSVYWETLYLQRHPLDEYYRFTFSVDFFAAQGDGRWWADHRVPGGVAFTANSLGHMRRYKEWYQGSKDQEDWMLRTAMNTIDSASDIGFDRATWLKTLADGKPVDSQLSCPLKPSSAKKFEGKDWTRYGGYLHTDLSIRDEFFFDSEAKPDHVAARSFNQDFAYIYDPRNPDFGKFVDGERVDFSEVVEQVGNPVDFAEIEAPQIKADSDSVYFREVEAMLDRCRTWALTPAQLQELEG